MHAVIKDVKRAYSQRKLTSLHNTEFLRVSLAVLQSLNRDVTKSEVTVDETLVRAFFNEGMLDYTFNALHEPGFFEESQVVRINPARESDVYSDYVSFLG